ncbi:MAG: hypothetical protein IT385_23550 [Deltaproteobacteria bacterium]|nr:hypothetical protein [Deltaproteobacteria bacterium]
MNVLRQLQHGLGLAPAAPRLMRRAAWARALVYGLLALVVLGGVAALVASQEGRIKRFIEAFLFPREVHAAVDFFLDYVVKSQTKQVIANAIVTATMALVSLTLFWAKERLSRAYEVDAKLGEPAQWRELTLVREGWEEVKLLLLNIAMLFIVLWLGHASEAWRKTAATVLSYLTLFFTMAVDFAAPYMQRREMRYSQIMGAIFRRPFLSLSFGAAMSLPLVAVAHLADVADWSPQTTMFALFGANVVMIVWAAVAGTWVGAQLHELALRVRPTPRWVQVPAWLALVGVLAGGVWLGAQLARSLATKSQILKCSYEVDWKTIEVGKPSLSGLVQGEVRAAVSVDVVITNPNPLAVVIEDNRLVAEDDGVVVAESRISPLSVPAGGSTKTRVGLDVVLKATSILGGGASINPLAWDLVLYVEISDGFEFPIYLRGGD